MTYTQDISHFCISDKASSVQGFGLDAWCLELILHFIDNSPDPQSIKLSWNWVTFNFDTNKTEDGDLIVSIYDAEERKEFTGADKKFPATMSNWGYANNEIRELLINRAKELRRKK